MAFANIAVSDEGEAACLAAGAAPVLVALAGTSAVKGKAGAAQWVAAAIYNIAFSAEGKAALRTAGAPAALAALAAQPAVRADADAAKWVGNARARLA